MYKLSEVKEYLADLVPHITSERVEQCYGLISNPSLRVNTQDEKWVACSQDHEIRTVTLAISEILNTESNHYDIVDEIVKEVCEFFVEHDITNKPRIPFYVLVLDRMIKE